MKIRDLFQHDVTRDIPPVVYFHESSPEKLQAEVSEYIVTGGFPERDPRHTRVSEGIHEAFVKLLRNIRAEFDKRPHGCDLPNAWISGFYGSGKSSFAKLLGLALDGRALPDGKPLAEALLERDTSPLADELRQAWLGLRGYLEPIAVVFDIGGVARDDEHIHAAVVRQVQIRLGYCSKSSLVAEHELQLEQAGLWEAFEAKARAVLGKPWSAAKDAPMAEGDFSHVLHALQPDRYLDPTSWSDAMSGRATQGLSVRDAVDRISAMLDIRAPGKALFLVVDEVSQYVHQDDDRMVKLQSFGSELGRLKGMVWLLVTGQAKLEDDRAAVHKLKDRFPDRFRVHLSPTNIRDVVHRRLLQKRSPQDKVLRELFQQHRYDLELHAFGCKGVTEEDFVEVYPMLPGQVDLLLQITSAIRSSSSRAQGDEYAIRGLLQLLGEIFRQQKLADQEAGRLIPLDAIYEVQQTALDSDLQGSMARVAAHCGQVKNPLALRAARTVALLQYVQEQLPTTVELVASCLYDRVGRGPTVQQVREALESLRQANLVGYSEKSGYKIQSSAGQEWQRERDDIHVTAEAWGEHIRERLKDLVGKPELPRLEGRPFKWTALYSDGQNSADVRLDRVTEETVVSVDFRFLKERDEAGWIKRSQDDNLRERLIWVASDRQQVQDLARDLARSQRMLQRYRGREASLPAEKKRLLLEEQLREEDLHQSLGSAVADAWMAGRIYFRGLELEPAELGNAFPSALLAAAQKILPDLYPRFTAVAVTEGELGQLLERQLAGPSPKFLGGDLAVLSLDAGRYVANAVGPVPTRILQHIEEQKGVSGAALFAHFGKPPYGYAGDVIRACLVGLLRGTRIRVQTETGVLLTSVNDPGARDLFTHERQLRRAEIFPAGAGAISPRDRVAICQFFAEYLKVEVERENDPIADAVHGQFAAVRTRLRQIEGRLNELPGRPALEPALQKLAKALEDCCRSRQVEEIVREVNTRLPVLRDGMQLLGIFESDLSDAAIQSVKDAARIAGNELAQLDALGLPSQLAEGADELRSQLASERPWREIGRLRPAVEAIRAAYRNARRDLLTIQDERAAEIRGRLEARVGFERLDDDQRYQVLRKIPLALFDTTVEAVAPSLLDLRDLLPGKLHRGEEDANDALDAALAAIEEMEICKVRVELRGRELAGRGDLSKLLAEIEDVIGPKLDQGQRVRITLG
ncbi:BREX system P-loop protein BrxC [Vulgatibacter incomptus]|nr:BREX system P-loop protein BrxC [Vulgatibacter incomptus]